MEKITIYTNETCPYCKQIKAVFKENNIDFTEKLTSNFREEWEDINDLTGIGIVPTILFKDNYFIPGRDFNGPQQLIEYISNFRPTSYDSSRKILERLKTIKENITTSVGQKIDDKQIISLINRGFNNKQIEFFSHELFMYWDSSRYWKNRGVK